MIMTATFFFFFKESLPNDIMCRTLMKTFSNLYLDLEMLGFCKSAHSGSLLIP